MLVSYVAYLLVNVLAGSGGARNYSQRALRKGLIEEKGRNIACSLPSDLHLNLQISNEKVLRKKIAPPNFSLVFKP